MGARLIQSDALREITALRAANERLTREVEWLKEIYAPATAFPSAWRLTAAEDAILAALYARKCVVSSEALHHAACGAESETDEKIVDVFVHKLRRKLTPILGNPNIETLWGRGFALLPHARAAIDAAIAGAPPHHAAPESIMAFEKIIVGLKKPKPLASMTLRDKRETGRPRCSIVLRQTFVDTFPITAKDKFEVQLGTGDDDGRMRFVRATEGVTTRLGGKGGATLFLGFVPALGEVAIERTVIETRLIDDNTFEIKLPDTTGEAAPRVTSLHMTSIEMVLGKSRIGKLQAAAAEAGEPVEKYAARFIASAIDEDDAAHAEAA